MMIKNNGGSLEVGQRAGLDALVGAVQAEECEAE